jgi:hypothetical protein
MDEAASLRPKIETVVHLIDLAMRRGDGTGLAALRRRAVSLLDPPSLPRTESDRLQEAIDFEVSVWIQALAELLLQERRDALARALADRSEEYLDGRYSIDPWTLADDSVRRASERRRTKEIRRAEHAALVSLRAYERTRRTSCLREAVSLAELAVEADRTPLCSGVPVDGCGLLADRLEQALRQELPPSIFRFLATRVRDVIADHLAEVTYELPARSSGAEQRLSRETWTARAEGEQAVEGWFVDWFQAEYKAEMGRDQLAEEADARRKAEEAEKVRAWQAARDEEATSRPSEEILPEPDAEFQPSARATSPAHGGEYPAGKETLLPDLGTSDYVAWPAHVEDAERYKETKLQKRIADEEEFRQAREAQAAKEAERLQAEAAEDKAKKDFEAWRMRKADPSWRRSHPFA